MFKNNIFEAMNCRFWPVTLFEACEINLILLLIQSLNLNAKVRFVGLSNL